MDDRKLIVYKGNYDTFKEMEAVKMKQQVQTQPKSTQPNAIHIICFSVINLLVTVTSCVVDQGLGEAGAQAEGAQSQGGHQGQGGEAGAQEQGARAGGEVQESGSSCSGVGGCREWRDSDRAVEAAAGLHGHLFLPRGYYHLTAHSRGTGCQLSVRSRLAVVVSWGKFWSGHVIEGVHCGPQRQWQEYHHQDHHR